MRMIIIVGFSFYVTTSMSPISARPPTAKDAVEAIVEAVTADSNTGQVFVWLWLHPIPVGWLCKPMS